MTTYRMIPITNPGFVADEYWKVRLKPSETDWLVTGIDIYWDKDCRFIKVEDVQFSDLPLHVRSAVYLELEHWVKARRERVHGLQRLLEDIGIQEPLRLIEGVHV